MQIIQVVPGIREEASGPSYSVPALAEALGSHSGTDVELHVLGPLPEFGENFRLKTYRQFGFPKRLGISAEMRSGLRQAAQQADILHNHSLWMMPNVYPGHAVRGMNCRLVNSPRGTLSEWSLRRSRCRKQLIWWWGQRDTLRGSHCFHATADNELLDIRRQGLRGPITVIPNGIDLPELSPKHHDKQLRQLLFLGRIHPKKGLDVLLQAWGQVQSRFDDWELVIAGPDNDGYLAKMQAFAESMGAERTRFIGPVYGKDKWEVYRQADLFVLPTHSENFGLTVAEALASETPAIVTHGAPWEGLNKHGCGWWIEQGEDALVECLRNALSEDCDELQRRGRLGRRWMEEDFSWQRIGAMMLETYRWILGGGAPPSFVDTTKPGT